VKTIGLAFGGGGARGVTHIAYLKAMEDMGLRPNVIAGTSSGVSPADMYAMLGSLLSIKSDLRCRWLRRLKGIMSRCL